MRSFNSTMVRLKVAERSGMERGHFRFNSTMVRLKGDPLSPAFPYMQCVYSQRAGPVYQKLGPMSFIFREPLPVSFL